MGWPIDDEQYSGETLFGYGPEDQEKDQTPAPKQAHKVLAAQRLLDWIQNDFARVTVSVRDICALGPRPLRNREIAIEAAEVLAKTGWLIPTKTHRHDRHEWQIVRKPIIQPTVATVAAK
jgi:hypothetical protein